MATGNQSPKRETTTVSAPPRRRRPLRWLALAIGAVAASGVITLLAMAPPERVHWRIKAERFLRANLFASGVTLPGTPDFASLDARLKTRGLTLGAPVFVRIFKREFELELWMLRDGRFHRFATYPVCRWSGRLGPKIAQGDRQAPEGFYTVDASQLNPNSRWHRSFNLGFPNAFDRAQGRTGDFLMVHGGCSSIGCFAMTDPAIDEIWRVITAALAGGQARFQVQVFPFRMSEANIASLGTGDLTGFWRSLKPGHDLFEADLRPPRISVCQGRYVAERGNAADGSAPIIEGCPSAAAGGA